MAICPRCQFSNPEGVGSCRQCGHQWATGGKAGGVAFTPPPLSGSAGDTGSHTSQVTGGGEPELFPIGQADDAAPGKNGTDIGMPALGQPQPSALTIRNRVCVPGRGNPTPPVEGPGAISTLDPALTKMSPKPAAQTPAAANGLAGTATPIPDRPVAASLAGTLAPSKTPAPPAKAIVPKLVVLRGERLKVTYPIYEGKNVIGRFADKPVDIDLEGQETVERIRVSRHHATIHFEKGELRIEDLNSLNGTWVNGVKIHPGQVRRLVAGDVVQVGTVQLKLEIEQPE